jgi:hypothetical protein
MARCLTFTVIIFCLAANPAEAITRADDDDLVEQTRPVVNVDRLDINPRDIPADIDNRVFGVDRSETRGAETSLLSQLERRVAWVARTTSLSEGQIDQLSLAGQGDIRRFLDRVDALKARFAHTPRGPNSWRELIQECQPLEEDFRRGVFTDHSLFAKTMTRMMTAEQIRQCKAIVRNRRRFQHRAGVHMTVLRLSTALGLSDAQQTQLKALLLRKTRPARTLEGVIPSSYFNVVYAQMPRIPEQKLRPLFEPWQWRALKSDLTSAANFGGRNLEPAGDDDDEVAPSR